MAGGDTATTFRASMALLATRRFGTFWFASLLSNIGTWAQQVAQPWLMLTLSGSAFLVGLDAFAMDAPVWLLTLLGGVLADRRDRRWIIFGFQSVQMLCPTLLVVLVLTGAVQPWMIIALSVVVGVTDALSMPSFASIVPSLVEKEQIGTAIALNSTQFNLSRILGPALAGVLLAGAGAAWCFGVSAASYVPFILVALWALPSAPPKHDGPRPPLFSGIGEIVRQPALRGALLTVFITAALCSPLITFCPVLVKDAFQAGAGSFSGAIAAFGVGGVLGATVLLGIEGRFERRTLSTRAGAVYGLLVLCAALTPWLWSLPVVLVFAGVAMAMSNTQANSVLQTVAGPTLRGQAASMLMLAMRGGMSTGSLVTGVTVEAMGVRQALLVNGALAVVLHLSLGRKWRAAPL
ncbi:MAG: MFS transporter [Myxococcota bacterium]